MFSLANLSRVFPLFFVILVGCEHKTAEQEPKSDSQMTVIREAGPFLGESYAKFRSQQVSDIAYKLAVDLSDESRFDGTVTIDFSFKDISGSPLTIDFSSGNITLVELNGNKVEWQYEHWFLSLPASLLNDGNNTLVIEYNRPYSNSGDGLYQYVDAHTKRRYLYTNFEPYNANKFFPHFDQPNLRASYELSVIAPSDWQVISTQREMSVVSRGNNKHWVFPPTAKISSYIFPLHAGPYKKWESAGEIPLRLFARQEMAEYVVPEDWFNYSKQSFSFFNQYFAYAYPFGKYDQIIVPDFNAGAMENVAAVTFAERLLSRGKQTEKQKLRLANIIAHEMAHMWFGDLVTMDWWNGLWLNESFATYMGHLAVAEAGDFDNVWSTFYTRMKKWAYYTDQLVTTHAIELPVASSADAFTNFDGITYGKGASVLKQLPHYLGEENFRQGVANYIKTYAYKNTQLDDFIDALAQASNKDLTTWTQDWLYNAGLNTIQAEFRCDESKSLIEDFYILQDAPKDHPVLREQRINIALIKFSEDGSAQTTKISALYRGKKTQITLPENTQCPDLVYPNADDWAYAKVLLDEQSIATLRLQIHSIDDDMIRMMLWESMWDAVMDTHITLKEYLDFSLVNLVDENDETSLELIGFNLMKAYNYFTVLAASDGVYDGERAQIEGVFKDLMLRAGPASDKQKNFFEKYLAALHTTNELKYARGLLLGELSIEGLMLDQDLRWQIILRLNQYAYQDYVSLTVSEGERDPSNAGELMSVAAQAIRANKPDKARWLNAIVDENSSRKLGEIRSVLKNLYPSSQVNNQREALAEIMRVGLEVKSSKDVRFVGLYGKLFDGMCSLESAEQLKLFMDQHGHDHPVLNKKLKVAIFESKRCVNLASALESKQASL